MARTMKFFSGSVLLGCACLAGGCDPPPPNLQELGRIAFAESEVPGADQGYTMPERLRENTPDEAEEGPPPAE